MKQMMIQQLYQQVYNTLPIPSAVSSSSSANGTNNKMGLALAAIGSSSFLLFIALMAAILLFINLFSWCCCHQNDSIIVE
mmetsp:Transcript_57326/g.83810  ORF Transcript_57326/g.83810 Transcript_57326/m.83810 type:complete len:80 (+) Transcript_57326:323-562(+)